MDGKSCSDSWLTPEFPWFFSRAEIAAIKNRSIVKGMSVGALYDSIGTPDSEISWGHGGKRLIYKTRLTVYLDAKDKVEDWKKTEE
jgi:hypothetical protein